MANQVTPIEGSDKVSRERFNKIVSETNAAFEKTVLLDEAEETVTPTEKKDADTLEGHNSSYFAKQTDLSAVQTNITNMKAQGVSSMSADSSGNVTFLKKLFLTAGQLPGASDALGIVPKQYVDNFIVTFTHSFSSSVHKLTCSAQTKTFFPAYFTATSDSKNGSSITVNNVTFTVEMINGGKFADYYKTLWVKGAFVFCFVDTTNKIIRFFPRVPAIFVSTSKPTSADGNDGDLWVVTE